MVRCFRYWRFWTLFLWKPKRLHWNDSESFSSKCTSVLGLEIIMCCGYSKMEPLRTRQMCLWRLCEDCSQKSRLTIWWCDAAWPALSPDLTTCNFWLSGYIKSKVFATKPQSVADLKNCTRNEISAIPMSMRFNESWKISKKIGKIRG